MLYVPRGLRARVHDPRGRDRGLLLRGQLLRAECGAGHSVERPPVRDRVAPRAVGPLRQGPRASRLRRRPPPPRDVLMRILLTGASSFTGLWFVEALVTRRPRGRRDDDRRGFRRVRGPSPGARRAGRGTRGRDRLSAAGSGTTRSSRCSGPGFLGPPVPPRGGGHELQERGLRRPRGAPEEHARLRPVLAALGRARGRPSSLPGACSRGGKVQAATGFATSRPTASRRRSRPRSSASSARGRASGSASS